MKIRVPVRLDSNVVAKIDAMRTAAESVAGAAPTRQDVVEALVLEALAARDRVAT